jgi:thermostable 8-oxoguanine DNA glycosylase
MNNRKIKSDPKNSVEKLKKLRHKFKTAASDYRAMVRETMANVMEIVLKLRSNKMELQRFLKLAKIKPEVANDE